MCFLPATDAPTASGLAHSSATDYMGADYAARRSSGQAQLWSDHAFEAAASWWPPDAVGRPCRAGVRRAGLAAQSPSLQTGFCFTMDRDTLWPNRSRMLSMLYRIMVGLRGSGMRCAGWVVGVCW